MLAIPVPPDIQFLFQSTPSIGVDPNDPSNVYVAFSGRPVELDPPEDNKIDLFIGFTNTGNSNPPPGGTGPFFQGAPDRPWSDNQRTYRIDDADLVMPGDPPLSTHHSEQALPALVIDELGGINVLYCQVFECVVPGCTETPATTVFRVRYARWPDRAALDAGDAPVVRELSPSPSAPWGNGQGNDYQGITASGCTVYAAWASQHLGAWHVFVSRIALPCPADADTSGTIDTVDPIVFAGQFAAQQPEADVNQDGLINSQDYSDFMNAYACGACPIP